MSAHFPVRVLVSNYRAYHLAGACQEFKPEDVLALCVVSRARWLQVLRLIFTRPRALIVVAAQGDGVLCYRRVLGMGEQLRQIAKTLRGA